MSECTVGMRTAMIIVLLHVMREIYYIIQEILYAKMSFMTHIPLAYLPNAGFPQKSERTGIAHINLA